MVEVCAVFCFTSCGQMPRDNRCMYMAHVCFMSVVVTVWGSVVYCVAAVVKNSVFLALEC